MVNYCRLREHYFIIYFVDNRAFGIGSLISRIQLDYIVN